MVTHRTRRLALRPPVDDDVDPLVELLADPEVARWWPDYDRPRVAIDLVGGDDEVGVIEHVGEGAEVTYVKVGECEHGTPYHEAVPPSGPIIGLVQIFEVPDPQVRYAGFNLVIGRPHWGQGFGGELARALVGELLYARDHHRLVFDPPVDNERAIRLCESLGFRRVGIMREYERAADGEYRDAVLLELLRSDHTADR